VLVVAADPTASPFRIVALPARRLHLRVPEIAHADDVAKIDAPELEDHSGMARSLMRYVRKVKLWQQNGSGARPG
jgi:hypothetical protein